MFYINVVIEYSVREFEFLNLDHLNNAELFCAGPL